MGSKGGGAVQPWGGAYNDAAMGMMPALFGGSVQQNKGPWGQVSYDWIPGGKSELAKVGEEYGKPNEYQQKAGEMLTGMDPTSFMQGVQGYLGQGAGMLGQAGGLAQGQGFGGSSDLLGRTIGGEFTDVANNPIYQARNQAVADQMQRFLGQNMQGIDTSAQRASGGVGAGSAATQQKGRAVQGAGAQLGETLAGLSAQDLASERANQMAAMQQGIQLPMQQAALLGNLASGYQGLGSIYGQAGTAAGNLGLQQAGALGNFGQQMAGQQLTGATLPYEYMMNFLTAARQSPGQAGPSVLGSILGGLGSAATGGANLYKAFA